VTDGAVPFTCNQSKSLNDAAARGTRWVLPACARVFGAQADRTSAACKRARPVTTADSVVPCSQGPTDSRIVPDVVGTTALAHVVQRTARAWTRPAKR